MEMESTGRIHELRVAVRVAVAVALSRLLGQLGLDLAG